MKTVTQVWNNMKVSVFNIFIFGCTVPLRKTKTRMSTVAMHSLRQICHTVADVYDTLDSQPITERSHRRNFSLTVRYCSDGRGRAGGIRSLAEGRKCQTKMNKAC